MGCTSCNQPKPSFPDRNYIKQVAKPSENAGKGAFSAMKNIIKTAVNRPDKLSWFVDGLSGLIKCVTNQKEHSKQEIEYNRSVCGSCEFATKNTEGKLYTHSQCMRPDPEKNNQPCGCFILCKTQVGLCDKWTELTINKSV